MHMHPVLRSLLPYFLALRGSKWAPFGTSAREDCEATLQSFKQGKTAQKWISGNMLLDTPCSSIKGQQLPMGIQFQRRPAKQPSPADM